jgi:purine nucleosidase
MTSASSHRKILIDTDTASDDAVALIMALRSPLVDVAAITTVAGNVSVEQGTRNALYTVELCGASVPVYAGASGPLLRPLETAEWFHGKDGLGDHGFTPSNPQPQSMHAVDAMIAAALANPGLEIVTLGPLTNVALALAREPRIASMIRRCVVMGGAPCCEGNVTPAAEFNIWVDPEAAAIVFRSGLPMELIGWQLSRHQAVVSAHETEAILALDTPLARFAIESNSTAASAYHAQTGEYGIALPDPIAMAVLLDPALTQSSSRHRVAIETASELTRGMTVVDRLNVSTDERNRTAWGAAPNPIDICWEIDVEGWKSALFAALR